jgi:hypothetical protein
MSKNDILNALNSTDELILAVEIVDRDSTDLSYVRHPFLLEPSCVV